MIGHNYKTYFVLGNQRKRLEAEIMTKGKVLEGHLLTCNGLVTFKIIPDLLDLN